MTIETVGHDSDKVRQIADATAGRYTLRSISRAIDALEILAAAETSMGVSDVARALGASKSTAFAILQTLEERNLVSSAGEGFQRRYELGLGLARLGHRAVSRVSMLDSAMPHLERLTKMTKLSSRVATMSQGIAVVLGQVDGPASVRFDLNMGGRERLHCTGIGKAILGQCTDAEVIELAEQTGLPRHTDYTITSIDALLDDIRKVRERGFSVDDEEDAEGVICIGAPLIDHTNACAGGISVTGLKVSLSADRVMRVGELVMATAEAISQRMGSLK
ncbi:MULTISPECIES: IclR family transcriptional regulator [Subtercola]|uniref:IclR family transcriptional regulator n=1 Tax=Subtercola vilae TaxID=2056433 RepID=A0A4T2C9U3_9MICO|nr:MULTISPECIES: IclR family transcriptional regulator [Subtercola]MEA9983943.1 IclR family transcriptional regulator [Subtercola sp. RTI3]TIH40980.1 IclR family transcriptional regulator [Subtercola vilae]